MAIFNYTITLKNYHGNNNVYFIEDNAYSLICSKYRVGIPLNYYSGSSLSNMNKTLDQLGISRIID